MASLTDTTVENDILIVGAGVAGLVLAQGLKHRGVPFRLFERDADIAAKSQGYRFRAVDEAIAALEKALSPDMWDLLVKTHALGATPNLMLLNAVSGRQIKTIPTHGSMSWPIDRPWFRTLLCLGIEENMHLGKAFESYELLDGANGGGVRVRFADGSSATGRTLVAADGIRSRVRKQMFPDFRLLDIERLCVWGRTPLTPEFERQFGRPDILSEHLASLIDPTDPRRCCFFAPIRWPGGGDVTALSGGKLKMPTQPDYMFVATCGEHPPPGTDLSTDEGRKAWCLSLAENWDPQLQVLLAGLTATHGIDISSSPPDVPVWDTDPRITFMGDAIHPMSPTGGVGGNTAIDDSSRLCEVITAAARNGFEPDGFRKALKEYEDGMRERAREAIELAFAGGKTLWQGQEWTAYSEVKE